MRNFYGREKALSKRKRKSIKNKSYPKNRESGYISDEDFEEKHSESDDEITNAIETTKKDCEDEAKALTGLIDCLQSIQNAYKPHLGGNVSKSKNKKRKCLKKGVVSKKTLYPKHHKNKSDRFWYTKESDEPIFQNCCQYKVSEGSGEVIEEFCI